MYDRMRRDIPDLMILSKWDNQRIIDTLNNNDFSKEEAIGLMDHIREKSVEYKDYRVAERADEIINQLENA